MSAVLTCTQLQPFDPDQDNASVESETERDEPAWEDASAEPETELEEPAWEPRRVHISRTLLWAILICFVLLVVAVSIWGFIQGTWWY